MKALFNKKVLIECIQNVLAARMSVDPLSSLLRHRIQFCDIRLNIEVWAAELRDKKGPGFQAHCGIPVFRQAKEGIPKFIDPDLLNHWVNTLCQGWLCCRGFVEVGNCCWADIDDMLGNGVDDFLVLILEQCDE